jgi:hypothetical protein
LKDYRTLKRNSQPQLPRTFRYTESVSRTHRDAVGSLIGILVFLGGVGLLALTFKLAYGLYTVPAEQALKLDQQKAIDVAATGNSLAGIILKTLLLLVMGLVSSVIASKGIQLYSHSVVKHVTETPAAVEIDEEH